MSLQNIKENKSWLSHKILPKTSKFVWYQPFQLLKNSNFFAFFFCYLFFSKKHVMGQREKR